MPFLENCLHHVPLGKEAGAFLLLAWWCEALSLKSVDGAQFVVLFVYVVA